MTPPRRIGLLGGTFDPIHFGHLDAAGAAVAALALDEVWLVPSSHPPHRTGAPRAGSFHRFALVALAVDGLPRHRASDLELARERAPYTIDTLRALHEQGWAPSQLFFILGADAFAEIATWHQYPAVLDAAHFVVVARPGTAIETAASTLPRLRARIRLPGEDPPEAGSTGIFLIKARTRDVSSTTVRARLAARAAIDDLVPAAVARHIEAHHLYTPVGDLHGEDQGR